MIEFFEGQSEDLRSSRQLYGIFCVTEAFKAFRCLQRANFYFIPFEYKTISKSHLFSKELLL